MSAGNATGSTSPVRNPTGREDRISCATSAVRNPIGREDHISSATSATTAVTPAARGITRRQPLVRAAIWSQLHTAGCRAMPASCSRHKRVSSQSVTACRVSTWRHGGQAYDTCVVGRSQLHNRAAQTLLARSESFPQVSVVHRHTSACHLSACSCTLASSSAFTQGPMREVRPSASHVSARTATLASSRASRQGPMQHLRNSACQASSAGSSTSAFSLGSSQGEGAVLLRQGRDPDLRYEIRQAATHAECRAAADLRARCFAKFPEGRSEMAMQAWAPAVRVSTHRIGF